MGITIDKLHNQPTKGTRAWAEDQITKMATRDPDDDWTYEVREDASGAWVVVMDEDGVEIGPL